MIQTDKMKEMLQKMLYGPDDDPNIKPRFGAFMPSSSEFWKEYNKAKQEGRVHDE